MKTTIRQAIKSALCTIREARRNRSVPCLMGAAFTVAVAGTHQCVNPCGEFDGNQGINFTGTWNRNTVYFAKEKAAALLIEIAPHYAGKLDLEVTHHNDLRDRAEAAAVRMISSLWAIRNIA